MDTNIYANLPEIVMFTSVDDAGEYDATNCPHCGAKGRYIYNFITADGQKGAAMKGCLKKFPMHRFAAEHQRIMEKQHEYKAKGWKLPSWDQKILDAIEQFAAGTMSEFVAQSAIDTAKKTAAKYRKSRSWR